MKYNMTLFIASKHTRIGFVKYNFSFMQQWYPFFVSITLFVPLWVACSIPSTLKTRKDISHQKENHISIQLASLQAKHEKGRVHQAIVQQDIVKLKKMIQEHPTDDAYFLMGKLYYQQKKYKNAYTAFMSVALQGQYGSQSRIQAVHCLASLDQENQRKAYALLNKILKTVELSPEERLRLYQLKIHLLQVTKNNLVEQIRTYMQMAKWTEDMDSKRDYRLKAISLLQQHFDMDDLRDMARDRLLEDLRGFVFFQMGFVYFDQGDFRPARIAFKKVLSFPTDEEHRQKAEDFLIQIDVRKKVNPYTIGAILPLSGEASVFGYKALRGLQLALGIFNAQAPEKNAIQLAVIDSESNSFVAKQAVQRLVTEDHVIAIVGSLMSKTADSVASTAQKFLVPSISLSQKNDVTQLGPYVFQNALTSQMQMNFLVDTVMSGKGFKRFAVLYPNDEYGTQYTNLFWDAVIAKGGQIVAAQSYTRDETDFRMQVQRLAGIFYRDDRKDEFEKELKEWKKNNPHSRREPSDLLKPLIFFDALFIPDEVKVMGQIAPMLAYNDIEDVTLLGTNLWNTLLLSKRAGKFLKNPIFVDSFVTTNSLFSSSQFYKDYVSTFQQPPSILEMQAFDTGLILKQIIENGANTRKKAQRMLARFKEIDGVLGSLKMTETRQITWRMVALTYENGQIVTLSPSASSLHPVK